MATFSQKFSRSVLCVGLSLCWVQCTPSGNRSVMNLEGASSSSADEIRIGEVASLTGSDAAFGVTTHRGIQVAFDEMNAAGGIHGRKLKLISLDNQGKPSEAVLATTKLIQQDQVVAILGEVASTLSIAMAPIAQQYHVPMISPSSINSKLTQQGNYIFRVCYLDVYQSTVMANFAYDHLKIRKVAILRDIKSDYSRDSADYFSLYFKNKGGQIVIDQSYSAGDVDFHSQLTAIRAVKPDLILIPGYYTEVGLIARQAVELGLQVPLLGGDGWDSPALTKIGGKAIVGSYYVGHFSVTSTAPHVQKFVSQYQEHFNGESPNSLAALGYDAAKLLADALSRTSGATGLRDAIAATHNFPGVTGLISINSDRNALKTAVVFQVTPDGSLKEVLRGDGR